MVSADEVGRSLRGFAALVGRRPEALALFGGSMTDFTRSFGAIVLTLPAYVVALARLRHELGLPPGQGLFADPGLAFLAALGHVAAFVALPLCMVPVARRFGLGAGYVPFVAATNWVQALGSLAIAAPSALMLAGLEPRPAADLLTVAAAVVVLHCQWFAARSSLGIGSGAAAAVAALGAALSSLCWLAVGWLA